MKTNKLGIPILDVKKYIYYIEGHSIVKNKYNTYYRFISHYRIFRIKKPCINNIYGIHIKKTII